MAPSPEAAGRGPLRASSGPGLHRRRPV